MTSLTQAGGDPVAIICGGGSLPSTVAGAARQSGRRVVLFPIRGWADPKIVEGYPHHWMMLATLGRFRRLAQMEGCRDVVLIGSALRPSVRDLRLDWLALRMLPGIARMFKGGDDHLLSGAAKTLESLGFRVLGAHEVAPEILMTEGPIGGVTPSVRDDADIQFGFELIAAMARFDVGQAVVVADNRVLTVEAAEGTDRMLDRLAALREAGVLRIPERTGVLIKAPKPTQDRRFDLPTIGPQTVAKAAQAKLAGIAVAAGEAVIAEPARVAASADQAGLFVVGKTLADRRS